jgi:hypothetical protein
VPPLPQPEIQRAGRVRRMANKSRRVGWGFCGLREFDLQKKRNERGRRQSRVRLRVLWVSCEVVGGTSATVLRLAMEFCAPLLRAMLEGRREQVA